MIKPQVHRYTDRPTCTCSRVLLSEYGSINKFYFTSEALVEVQLVHVFY